MVQNPSLWKISFLLLASIVFVSCFDGKRYRDTSLPFDERVDDLVARMSLEEKVSQLQYNSPQIPRLGIPEYNWWNECLHGVGRAGIATVFPQAIGMAAMWDDKTMAQIATVISDEARAKHHNYIHQNNRGIYHGLTFWTPNINIFRDPRWGRGMETYGEDPFLTGKLGVAFIEGLQGNHPKYYKLIATAKHFAVHSGPESTRHSFDVYPDPYDFLETYSPQFKQAVRQAGVYSVMCAYNRYQGLPCCGNKKLSDILRNEWGFDGYIVSDCWAIRDFYTQNAHEVVNTKAEAAAMAVQAGTDLNCGDSYPALVEAVDKGFLTEGEIDVSLKRLLLARMKLGMFDPEEQVPFASIPYNVVDSEPHHQLALEAAHKSMVLLKNEGQLLPFTKKINKVAVIGPNANSIDVLLGNYNGYPSNPITPYIGIKEKLPAADVVYAQGCNLACGLPFLTAIPADVLYTDSTKTTHGLMGHYFNGLKLTGKPDVTRVDNNIDFEWWANGPGGKISGNTFCVAWTGVLSPDISGNYAIGGEGYSKYALWIDGQKIIDSKSIHKQYEFFQLEAGQSYPIRIEYQQDNTDYAMMRLLWQEPGNTLKEEALDLAKESDLVVLCMGLSPMLEGEEMKVKVEGFSNGDREHIFLPDTQSDLIKEIKHLGKPTILVLLNGSALAVNWENDHLPAIIEAWYPGQAGGAAIADVIFGDYNPSGRLPVTFYKSIDQLPAFDDYNMQGRTYRYFDKETLYPFGYGLSYSTFKYSNLVLPETIKAGENLEISVQVTNVSNIDGEEVAQLYIAHPDSKYRVPIRALKGFQRIFLKAGEAKNIHFVLPPEDMAVLDQDNHYIVVNGDLMISLGGGQPDAKSLEEGTAVASHVKVVVENDKFFAVSY